jgi:tetratricopeptide (TPR) repeat protein
LKAMGTITKYYKFIDDEAKSILDAHMKESSNYFDLVHRLTDLVLEKQVSDNLVYITAAQLWYVSERDLLNATVKKYKHLAFIKPWLFYWGTQESGYPETCQDILKSLEPLRKPLRDSWIVAELLLAHAYNLAGVPEAMELLSTGKAILDQESSLTCFRPLAYLAEGCIYSTEGKRNDAIAHCRKSIDYARAKDDAVYEFFPALFLAIYTINRNPQESIDLFEEVYQNAQVLAVPVFKAEALHSVSISYETLGEYDLAISSELECIKEFNAFGNEIPYATLSRYYAAIGDGQQALEWADHSLDDKKFPGGYSRKTHALILLNRLDEAEKFLNVSGQKMLQMGSDMYLARHHFFSGLLEMAKGEYATALGTLEQAYEIHHSIGNLVSISDDLIALSKVELALLGQSKNSDEPWPGTWLSKLETHASKFDLPGIAMQAALLRSEGFKIQGQLQDARETLQGALGLSDSPGVKTLRKRIRTRMTEIEIQLHDEELVS